MSDKNKMHCQKCGAKYLRDNWGPFKCPNCGGRLDYEEGRKPKQGKELYT